MNSYPFKIGLILLVLVASSLCIAQAQDEELTVNATTTDVEDPSKKGDIKEANKLSDIFLLQKQLVYKLLQNIGITQDKLSPALRTAIDRPQTTNIKAFKAFCNCLDLKDKRQFAKAREQCEEAVKNDPNFALARQLLETMPDQDQTMQEIVSDHMNRAIADFQGGKNYGMNTIPPDEPPVTIPSDTGGETCQASGGSTGCQVGKDRSSPPCDNNGHCGFYSTFLARQSRNGDVSLATSPFMNRRGVGIPPSNASGAISINQIGREGNGFLNLQLDPGNQVGQVTAFREGQFNQGSRNISDGQLDRIVTNQFTTNQNVTGLELGSYLSGFDFNGRLGNIGGNNYDLFHGAVYFAEGKVTPIDTVKNLGRVQYDGVVNGDFSVNGQLVPCQGCGSFTSTLNYAAAKLVNYNLVANAQQVDGNLTAAARITAHNVSIKPTGEFQFDQKTAGAGGGFQVGTSQQNLTTASGVVAGRPFGSRADWVGGVFAIHGGTIQGAGNFGGRRR
ncbi:hypothetical protein MGMO_120c00140 [Methyloglobulus morosus KoM1]|uniref:Uncharacterized protein n=1 Tax=Methyloglobulus morosus KoM1 TaxID=1116472 RepID=V5BWN7_9GAMM|nr:hypothetical protein [Methyloglobulus morosus]ESS70627.1 hypothetical protein MGMO_120c00140 [Methyloglobulus morosus KoM1]